MSTAALPPPGLVYLLHFDQPYRGRQRKAGGRRQTIQHYIGWTGYDLEQRLEHHAHGLGARVMQVVSAAGITFQPVRQWRADRRFERRLKSNGHYDRYCPTCNPHGWQRCMAEQTQGRKDTNP